MRSETIARSKQFFSNFDHKKRLIVAHVDKDVRFQKTTDYLVSTHGFKSSNQVEGATMFDIKCDIVRSAPELERQWHKTIRTEKMVQILDLHRFASGQAHLLLTSKFPTYTDDYILEGAGAICHEITDPTANTTLCNLLLSGTQKYLDGGVNISISCEIVDCYEELNLTAKESECLYFIVRGRSSKMIGELLHRSPRTVETHIINMKEKLSCTSRADLVDTAFAYGVLNQIPRSLVTKILPIS
jgi:DNA-binding CsgD family transcriptional regulator